MTQIPDAASRALTRSEVRGRPPPGAPCGSPSAAGRGPSDTARRGFLLLLPGIQEQRAHRHHEETCGVYLQTMLGSRFRSSETGLHAPQQYKKETQNSQEDTGKSLCVQSCPEHCRQLNHPSQSRLPTLLPTHSSWSRLSTLLPTHPSPSQLLTLLPTHPSQS